MLAMYPISLSSVYQLTSLLCACLQLRLMYAADSDKDLLMKQHLDSLAACYYGKYKVQLSSACITLHLIPLAYLGNQHCDIAVLSHLQVTAFHAQTCHVHAAVCIL